MKISGTGRSMTDHTEFALNLYDVTEDELMLLREIESMNLTANKKTIISKHFLKEMKKELIFLNHKFVLIELLIGKLCIIF